jgi:hypothetical protein
MAPPPPSSARGEKGGAAVLRVAFREAVLALNFSEVEVLEALGESVRIVDAIVREILTPSQGGGSGSRRDGWCRLRWCSLPRCDRLGWVMRPSLISHFPRHPPACPPLSNSPTK